MPYGRVNTIKPVAESAALTSPGDPNILDLIKDEVTGGIMPSMPFRKS